MNTAVKMDVSHAEELVPQIPSGELKDKLDRLCQSAYHSLQLIEPWTTATSDIPEVAPIIGKVNKHGEDYYRALGESIDASNAGYEFSTDCEVLCHALSSGLRVQDAQEHIASLLAHSQRALDEATASRDRFRDVRSGFYEAAGQISNVVDKFREDGVSLESITFLMLPDQLPLHQPTPMSQEDGMMLQNRVAKPRDDEEVTAQLFVASEILVKLIGHVGVFVDWWVELQTRLSAMEAKARVLNPAKIVKLSAKANERQWREIREMYMNYNSTIQKLQDYFPTRHRQPLRSSTPSPNRPTSPLPDRPLSAQAPPREDLNDTTSTSSKRTLPLPRPKRQPASPPQYSGPNVNPDNLSHQEDLVDGADGSVQDPPPPYGATPHSAAFPSTPIHPRELARLRALQTRLNVANEVQTVALNVSRNRRLLH